MGLSAAEKQSRYRAKLAERERGLREENARLRAEVERLRSELARRTATDVTAPGNVTRAKAATPNDAEWQTATGSASGGEFSEADWKLIRRRVSRLRPEVAMARAWVELDARRGTLESVLKATLVQRMPTFAEAEKLRTPWTTQESIDYRRAQVAEQEAIIAAMQRWIAAGAPDPRAATLERLRAEVQRTHPDKGGDAAAFIKAKRLFDAARGRRKKRR